MRPPPPRHHGPPPAGECLQPPRFVFAEPTEVPEPPYPAGTALRYKCRPGYKMSGGKSPLVTCAPNSTWLASPDFCVGECPLSRASGVGAGVSAAAQPSPGARRGREGGTPGTSAHPLWGCPSPLKALISGR